MSPTPPPIPEQPQIVYQVAAPRRRIWPWILLLVGLGIVGFFGLMFAGMASAFAQLGQAASFTTKSRHFQTETVVSGSRDKIAHLDLEGIITGSAYRGTQSMVDDFQRMIEAAADDSSVKAIVVRIHSPGGEVTASDRIYELMRRADQVKPVVAYLDTIAASGGYYAACGSRFIVSHPTTFTGSIGVIMQSLKYRELLDKVGLSMEVYKSGELKDLLSGTRATTPAEAALIDELVQETYTRFLQVIGESRSLSVEQLRASPLTDGRVFSGAQALAAGMVDSNGYLEEAYQKAMELSDSPGASVVRYTARIGFFDVFSLMGKGNSASGKRVEIDVSDRLLPRLQSGVPLYLHVERF